MDRSTDTDTDRYTYKQYNSREIFALQNNNVINSFSRHIQRDLIEIRTKIEDFRIDLEQFSEEIARKFFAKFFLYLSLAYDIGIASTFSMFEGSSK